VAQQAKVAAEKPAQPELLKTEKEVEIPKMVVNGPATGGMDSSNYLDIPAFLRRQAD